MKISLENQVAVVTGGSRGIGASIVRLFAEEGCNVVFSYLRSARAAREVEKACRQAPEVAMPVLFLASDKSTYMTGEIININGGNVLCG